MQLITGAITDSTRELRLPLLGCMIAQAATNHFVGVIAFLVFRCYIDLNNQSRGLYKQLALHKYGAIAKLGC